MPTATPDQFECLVRSFHRVMSARAAQVPPAWLDVELSMPQVKALMVICARGSVHGRGLARALGIGHPAVSKLVDQLVERGYASREEDESDRRVTWLRPTEAGLALRDRLTLANRETIQAILSELSPQEREVVGEAWKALTDAAERLYTRASEISPRPEEQASAHVR